MDLAPLRLAGPISLAGAAKLQPKCPWGLEARTAETGLPVDLRLAAGAGMAS
ncbi:hypothetical protein [Kamptonema formosum]|uniref:hypothetical protein n=1 Tax=Kamptonema formosum TaxID=331992 RepID=UPI0012DCA965|nr:hypothetical protein [Oscillatoria sp. PCC 10802]